MIQITKLKTTYPELQSARITQDFKRSPISNSIVKRDRKCYVKINNHTIAYISEYITAKTGKDVDASDILAIQDCVQQNNEVNDNAKAVQDNTAAEKETAEDATDDEQPENLQLYVDG